MLSRVKTAPTFLGFNKKFRGEDFVWKRTTTGGAEIILKTYY